MKDYNLPANDDDYKLSKLNAAGLINVTIENIFQKGYLNYSNNKLWMFNQCLDSIWMILAGDEPEDSEWVKKFNDIEIELGNTGSLFFNKMGFDKPTKEYISNQSLQKQLLKKKAIFLRRLQNKQGKGTAYKEEDDDWE